MIEKEKRALKVRVGGQIHNAMMCCIENKTAWRYGLKAWNIIGATREPRSDYMRVEMEEAV